MCKTLPWDERTYFTTGSTKIAHAFELGKLVKCNQSGKLAGVLSEDFFFIKKLLYKGLSVPAPGIHVYDHNIQTSSLKQIGQ